MLKNREDTDAVGELHDPRQLPYPQYILTLEDRERWDLSVNIAKRTWELYEDGPPTEQWMFSFTRSTFRSDIPTGQAETKPKSSG